MTKKFFTTCEAADLCGVAHTTVIRWISEGKLKAYETPGGHRRIPLAQLITFMKKFHIPMPDSLAEKPFYILVIDDEKDICNMIKSAFEEFLGTVEVRTCANGIDALVMIGKEHPSLIILDVLMPEMDGVQMCQKLKESKDTEDIKIIAMSGKKLSEEQQSFLAKNSNHFVKKPFSPSAMVDKAKELLDLP
jgi:excisionase family DNA binding protein